MTTERRADVEAGMRLCDEYEARVVARDALQVFGGLRRALPDSRDFRDAALAGRGICLGFTMRREQAERAAMLQAILEEAPKDLARIAAGALLMLAELHGVVLDMGHDGEDTAAPAAQGGGR